MPLFFSDPALIDVGAGLYLLQMMLGSLAIIILAMCVPGWYLRHRTAVILTRQMVTMLAFHAWVLPSPFFSHMHPLVAPDTLLPKLRSFLTIPILLLHAALSHPLPLHAKRIVLGITTIVAGRYTANRCAVEVARFEEAGRAYSAALTAADAFLRRWSLLSTNPAIVGEPTDAAMLSGYGACVAIHTTAQLTLGVLFPAAVLAAEETVSRKAFELHHALSTAFTYSLKATLALNLLLVSVEALVSYYVVARALAMAGAVAWPPAAPQG